MTLLKHSCPHEGRALIAVTELTLEELVVVVADVDFTVAAAEEQ